MRKELKLNFEDKIEVYFEEVKEPVDLPSQVDKTDNELM